MPLIGKRDYHPLEGRRIVDRPKDSHQGTTVLVVTYDSLERRYVIEAAKTTEHGFEAQREVIKLMTRKEVRVWMAGNRWNPGGPISRPMA